MKQIPLFLAPVTYHNLHVARVCKDGELILRRIRVAPKVRSMWPVPSSG